ncbi:MAG TPA: LON peptidase substrate-binding domain-containing protein [Polyangiaceae bacterium]|nr:LON peptidase substrate-binding domain-containing protein [Polyangiaceae bacterium]
MSSTERDEGSGAGRSEGGASRGLAPHELADLPLFPLPGVVFFPHTYLPLHVFEPRYRALVETALARGGSMGVVQLRRDLPTGAGQNRQPEVCDITGVGRIVEHERLPDGRYLILIEGLARARILRELSTAEPFRRFELAVLPERELEGDAAQAALGTLRGCVRALAPGLGEAGEPLLRAVEWAKAPGALADLLASALIDDATARQRLLETLRASQRVDDLVALLSSRLLDQRPGSRPGWHAGPQAASKTELN